MPVIKRFITGVEESGKYSGFCTLGVSCQATENVQLRECFGMRPEMTGVLVSRINPLSNAYKILKKDDILLEFDGVPIANDGTGELISFYICNTSICISDNFMLLVLFFHLPFYYLQSSRFQSTIFDMPPIIDWREYLLWNLAHNYCLKICTFHALGARFCILLLCKSVNLSMSCF